MSTTKKIVPLTATITTTNGTAYAAADNIGGKLKLKPASGTIIPTGGFGRIRAILLADKGKQDSSVDINFYSSDPSATTFTNDAAQVIHDDDIAKIQHVENLTTYDDYSANSVAGAVSLDTLVTFTDALYCSLISRGTPTYTSTTDLILTVLLEVEL